VYVAGISDVALFAFERYDPELGGGGRVILNSISADYLARKGGTDEH
jgi:hypothetical protein